MEDDRYEGWPDYEQRILVNANTPAAEVRYPFRLIPAIKTIDSYAFLDQNGNGLPDVEPYVINERNADVANGLAVELLDLAGNVLATTTTARQNSGNTGYFAFADQAFGDYRLRFTPPAGDGNPIYAPTTPLEQSVTVSPEQFPRVVTFGFEPFCGDCVSGRVFFDNGDGAFDPAADSPYPGQTIRLTGPDGSQQTDVTDDQGTYRFENLTPLASYLVELEWTAPLDPPALLARPATSGIAGLARVDYPLLAGDIAPSAVVFYDVNLDGAWTPETDPPVDGVTVDLLDGACATDGDVVESAVAAGGIGLFRTIMPEGSCLRPDPATLPPGVLPARPEGTAVGPLSSLPVPVPLGDVVGRIYGDGNFNAQQRPAGVRRTAPDRHFRPDRHPGRHGQQRPRRARAQLPVDPARRTSGDAVQRHGGAAHVHAHDARTVCLPAHCHGRLRAGQRGRHGGRHRRGGGSGGQHHLPAAADRRLTNEASGPRRSAQAGEVWRRIMGRPSGRKQAARAQTPTMTTALRQVRLASQRLARPLAAGPGAVPAWFGAIQAQDVAGARWAVGLRAEGATEASVIQALADRAFVRTWLNRGTLHFVAAADVRWMLALLGPRLIAANARRNRQLGLDEATFARGGEVLAGALGSGPLTRAETLLALNDAGIATGGQRGYHLLRRAAQEGWICLGPEQRGEQTFVWLEAWLPPGPTLDQPAALAELAARYFQSHGPATLADFVWCSGLTVADARAAIARAAGRLERTEGEGVAAWQAADVPPTPDGPPAAHLLPAYDEYFVGYRDRSAILDRRHDSRVVSSNGVFRPIILVDGRVAGIWKRASRPARGTPTLTLAPFEPLTAAAREAVAAAAARYSAFLGLPMVIVEE